MNDEPRITTYRRLNPTGTVRKQIAGVTLTPIEGGFRVAAAELDGLRPRADDRVSDAAGSEFRVAAAMPAEGGHYDLTCEPVGGGS